MEKSIKRILTDARDLISKKKWYTSDHYAEDLAGQSCSPKSEAACRWCAEGAIYASDGVDEVLERASQGGPTERKFRSEIGHACVLYIERYAHKNKVTSAKDTEAPLQLRFVAKSLRHRQILQLLDDAVASL